MSVTRTLARLATSAAALAAVVCSVVLAAAPAGAHVTITPTTTAAGSEAVLAVRVPHGCEGSATTAVTIRLPGEVQDVRPVASDRWEHELGDGQVTYRAVTALPDQESDVFELAVRLPDTAGARLFFPVIQTCEVGEVAWIEVAGSGQDPEDLERPAPVVVVAGGTPAEVLTSSSSGLAEPE